MPATVRVREGTAAFRHLTGVGATRGELRPTRRACCGNVDLVGGLRCRRAIRVVGKCLERWRSPRVLPHHGRVASTRRTV